MTSNGGEALCLQHQHAQVSASERSRDWRLRCVDIAPLLLAATDIRDCLSPCNYVKIHTHTHGLTRCKEGANDTNTHLLTDFSLTDSSPTACDDLPHSRCFSTSRLSPHQPSTAAAIFIHSHSSAILSDSPKLSTLRVSLQSLYFFDSE
jgi:hypothetical protein